MKKLKKLFAVMLSLVMVLAMGITSFADTNSATITLTGFSEADKVEYMQIIQKDETKSSPTAFYQTIISIINY